jgi:hypothetical protein
MPWFRFGVSVKVLVCGGRDFYSEDAVFSTLDLIHRLYGFTALHHGAAKGADRLAGKWAEARGIPVTSTAADWQNHGLSAGPRRNRKMLKEFKPDLVVAFPGDTGTAHMVGISRTAGVRVITHEQSVTQPCTIGRAAEIMKTIPTYEGKI